MEWIRVRDHVDEIVQNCFTEEHKNILEFAVGTKIMSLKEQFLYHYWHACYKGSKEGLIRAIIYRLHVNLDLLLRIQDLRENVRKVTELGEYSKVTLGYKESLGTETTIGASAGISHSENLQTDNYQGTDSSVNLNISDDRTATSQTNSLNPLNIVIPQPSISENTSAQKTYSINDNNITESEQTIPKYSLNNPQIQEGDNPLGYQNVTKDLSTSEGTNTTNTKSSRGAKTQGDFNNRGASANVKGTKGDEINRTSEFITNDARIKMWKLQIPKLRTRFWNCLYTLFDYDVLIND